MLLPLGKHVFELLHTAKRVRCIKQGVYCKDTKEQREKRSKSTAENSEGAFALSK